MPVDPQKKRAEELHTRLLALREELRATDKELFDKIISRHQTVQEIGAIKFELGLPVIDEARERENLEINKQYVEGRLDNSMVEAITDLLVKWSREAQQKRS